MTIARICDLIGSETYVTAMPRDLLEATFPLHVALQTREYLILDEDSAKELAENYCSTEDMDKRYNAAIDEIRSMLIDLKEMKLNKDKLHSAINNIIDSLPYME
jgi:hypothetical protein